jgi:hypothetical protein
MPQVISAPIWFSQLRQQDRTALGGTPGEARRPANGLTLPNRFEGGGGQSPGQRHARPAAHAAAGAGVGAGHGSRTDYVGVTRRRGMAANCNLGRARGTSWTLAAIVAANRSLALAGESSWTLAATSAPARSVRTRPGGRRRDIDSVRSAYEVFISDFLAIRPSSGEVSFRRQTLLVHAWRKFRFLDPDLPAELLPAGWPRRRARDLFSRWAVVLRVPRDRPPPARGRSGLSGLRTGHLGYRSRPHRSRVGRNYDYFLVSSQSGCEHSGMTRKFPFSGSGTWESHYCLST